MTDYVFAPPPVPSVAVAGEAARFPVRRILCVGRNYAEHAREMGGAPEREPPFFFAKPADAVVATGTNIPFPPLTHDLHHEIELVVAIGKAGANVRAEWARDLIYGYAVGIDLTRRDLQAEAKRTARPWDWAKGFDCSAPCGDIVPATRIGHPRAGRIWLDVNGQTRQTGDIADMIWDIEHVIAYASAAMVLQPGDLIYTGTPAGVGPLVMGDRVTGGVEGVGEIRLEVAC